MNKILQEEEEVVGVMMLPDISVELPGEMYNIEWNEKDFYLDEDVEYQEYLDIRNQEALEYQIRLEE
jgi:hypothetical protein